MPTPRDPAMLLAAARLYYLEGQSQAEVATTLGTSRSNVSRMLTEAQNQGIVEIRINDPEGRVHDLEDQLRATFGLREARVAQATGAPGLRTEDQVGRQASRLLLENLKDSMTVALSWGHALQSMVYATTSDQEFHRVSLVQLVGGMSAISNEISGQELVRELAVRIGAEYRLLHTPATVESPLVRDALLAEPSIAQALAESARADLAFVGIGTPGLGSSAALLDSMGLSAEDRTTFWSAEPAGDVAARFFDTAGRPLHGGVDDRVIGVSLDELVKIPHVVGVAQGRAKAGGVMGALRGRLIDSLVCDESLARVVLTEARETFPTGGTPS
ncbi:MAG: sugar-binding transcriptional regulator [Nocardioides sp.]